MERQQRAKHLHPASFDLKSLPQVRLPYRMWRAPALDFVVSARRHLSRQRRRAGRPPELGLCRGRDRASVLRRADHDRRRRACRARLRLRAYRSDPDGGLLGPLKATHFGFGDVEGFDSRLTGSAASGRGAVITNRPLTAQAAFDRTRFEGDLPSRLGSRNLPQRRAARLRQVRLPASAMCLTTFSFSTARTGSQIVLYGPQGQIRTREETDQRRPGQRPGRQDLVLGRLQPARRATSSRSRSLRTAPVSPRRRRPSRSSTASTTARRSACSRA